MEFIRVEDSMPGKKSYPKGLMVIGTTSLPIKGNPEDYNKNIIEDHEKYLRDLRIVFYGQTDGDGLPEEKIQKRLEDKKNEINHRAIITILFRTILISSDPEDLFEIRSLNKSFNIFSRISCCEEHKFYNWGKEIHRGIPLTGASLNELIDDSEFCYDFDNVLKWFDLSLIENDTADF